MDIKYKDEMLAYEVMTKTEENQFGSKQVLVAAFSIKNDAIDWIKYRRTTLVNLSLWYKGVKVYEQFD